MAESIIDMLGMNIEYVQRSSQILSLNEQPALELIEDRYYLEYPRTGVAFIAHKDKCVGAIQLYSQGYEQYDEFRGEMPNRIRFSTSRTSVRELLGQPSASGDRKVLPILGTTLPWDRFDEPLRSIHIQYTENESAITMVTIMTPSFVPK